MHGMGCTRAWDALCAITACMHACTCRSVQHKWQACSSRPAHRMLAAERHVRCAVHALPFIWPCCALHAACMLPLLLPLACGAGNAMMTACN